MPLISWFIIVVSIIVVSVVVICWAIAVLSIVWPVALFLGPILIVARI